MLFMLPFEIVACTFFRLPFSKKLYASSLRQLLTSTKLMRAFQRKYRTRFSCAISPFLPHHQIMQPSTYIKPNGSILFQNFLFSGESNEAQEQRKSHDKRMTRRNVLCHVSRNRPHPTIYFPFQTGDRVRNKYC